MQIDERLTARSPQAQRFQTVSFDLFRVASIARRVLHGPGSSGVVVLPRAGLLCTCPGMQVVDFFNLERSLQDRFVEAASGSVPPTPIAFRRARPRTGVLVWWAV